jgi:membrane-associated PAP2 superfamily phosphatase
MLALVAVLATVPFWISDLDLRVAALFYHPEDPEGPWPLRDAAPWIWIYHSSAPLTAIAGIGSLLALALARGRKHIRQPALLLFLSLVVGPGLLVNAIFKDHWGRPRPNHIVEFSGTLDYLPPLAKGVAGQGKSFPSGHASVGFLYGALWWYWRDRSRRLAFASLAIGTVLGCTLGLARIVAGNHFLSDIMWSAVMVLGAAGVLEILLFRWPARATRLEGPTARLRLALPVICLLLAVAILAWVLLNTPVHKDLAWAVSEDEAPPGSYEIVIEVDRLHVDLELVGYRSPPVEFSGSVHGFGLPNCESKRTRTVVAEGAGPKVFYRVEQHGTFLEIDGRLRAVIDVTAVDGIVVRTSRGDIRVSVDSSVTDPPPMLLDSQMGRVLGADQSDGQGAELKPAA